MAASAPLSRTALQNIIAAGSRPRTQENDQDTGLPSRIGCLKIRRKKRGRKTEGGGDQAALLADSVTANPGKLTLN